MKCPRDGSQLTARIYEAEVEIDECGACGGVFLDDGELERIQATMEQQHPDALKPVDSVAEGHEAARNEALERVACPRCGELMARRPYGFGSQILVDVCSEGCGLWLDAGELQALERFYERSHDEASLPLTWRLYAAVRGLLGGGKTPVKR